MFHFRTFPTFCNTSSQTATAQVFCKPNKCVLTMQTTCEKNQWYEHTDRQTDSQTCCAVSFVQTACCTTPNSPIPRVLSTVIQSSLIRHRQTGTFTSPTPGSATFFTKICYHTSNMAFSLGSSLSTASTHRNHHIVRRYSRPCTSPPAYCC